MRTILKYADVVWDTFQNNYAKQPERVEKIA